MSSGGGTTAEPCRPFIYAYDPQSFSFSFIYSFLAYYFIFTALEMGLTHFFKPFRKLPKLQQRNFLVYVSELVITSVLLVPWLVFGIYLFVGETSPPDEDTRRGIVIIAVFLVNLYLYEIAYKITTPKSLLIHHVSTMLLVILAVYRYQYNGKIVSIRGVFTLGLTALTEQTTFVALILYRAKKAWCLWPLLFAAAFTLISKTGFLAWTIQIVVDGEDEFWYYTFGPTAGLLFISQIYGAYVLVAIWRKARKDLRLERLKQMSGAGAGGDDSDLDSMSMDGDGDKGKAENGNAVRRERRKSALVVMGDRVMSLGGQRKKKDKPEENGNGLDHAERGEDGEPQPRPRADSAVERFINVVRERGTSISNQVVEHVRMGDEHVEDVV